MLQLFHQERIMSFFKKHSDAAAVIGVLLTIALWLHTQFKSINDKIYDIDMRLTRIETILFMHNMIPKELAVAEPKDKPSNF